MPYTAPAAISSGAVISKTTFGDVVIADLNFLANPPACRVYHNTTQAIAHNSNVALTFNTERYDTDTMHSTVTNAGRITFTTAGLYEVKFNAKITAATDYTYIRLWLRRNGTQEIAATLLGGNLGTDFNYESEVSTVWKFSAADYVEAFIRQKNGAAASRNAIFEDASSPEFMATWVGLG